jgi:hypothetical protein
MVSIVPWYCGRSREHQVGRWSNRDAREGFDLVSIWRSYTALRFRGQMHRSGLCSGSFYLSGNCQLFNSAWNRTQIHAVQVHDLNHWTSNLLVTKLPYCDSHCDATMVISWNVGGDSV